MELEIERKFLLKKDFDINNISCKQKKEIKQGYLISDINFRVRIVNDQIGYITYKEGSGLIREEYETEIPLDMAIKLFEKSIKSLIKTRFLYEYKGKLWELDYFPKYNLWLAEIELKSDNEEFEIPSFIKKEVTSISKYSNQKLAT